MASIRAVSCAAVSLTMLGCALPAAAQNLEPATAPDPSLPAASQDQAPPDGRRAQLGLHQAMGLGTLGALAAAGIAGGLYSQQRGAGQPAPALTGLSTAHLALAAVAGAAYLTTATLAITAPAPDFASDPASNPASDPASDPAAGPTFEGVDSVLVHRGLAVLHALGIGSTVALGVLGARNDPAYTDAHKVLGVTTFGLMTASAAVIAIDF